MPKSSNKQEFTIKIKGIPLVGLVTSVITGMIFVGILSVLSLLSGVSLTFYSAVTVIFMIFIFGLCGILFDLTFTKIPVKAFHIKTAIFWAVFFPVCRVLVGVLPIVQEHMSGTLTSIYGLAYFLIQTLLGAFYGFWYALLYIDVFSFLCKRVES